MTSPEKLKETLLPKVITLMITDTDDDSAENDDTVDDTDDTAAEGDELDPGQRPGLQGGDGRGRL